MKKVLSFMVVSLFVFLPLVVNAEDDFVISCSTPNAENVKECTISYKKDQGINTLEIKLTEQGGAEVSEIAPADSSFGLNGTPSEINNVWTVNIMSNSLQPVTGEPDLIKFKVKESGQEGCAVDVQIDGKVKNTGTSKDDGTKPEDDKQTGSTLPYIALGSIAVISVGAYMSLKNKAKMYKI